TLAVGPKAPFLSGAFIKGDPTPLKGLHNIGLRPFHKSVLVGILDAQQKIPLMLFGKKVIEQGSSQSSNVQRPRGTWGKSHPYFIIHFFNLGNKDTVPRRF